MNAEEYPGRGELPDALAFMNPNRARAYVALERADGPLSAAELATDLDCSSATAYRCLSDLQAADLVRETTRLDPDAPPKAAYQTVPIAASGGGERAATDGGERE